ncbi:MAG: SGNH/GDSL hydrolase family protein [Candidatus Microsaccharimonas sp.]
MKEIVLFGDSLLGRFNNNLIDQLEQTIPSSNVYNCAAGGWNSNDGIKRVEYIAMLSPDVVVLSFGANDTAPWKEQVALSTFIQNMEFMVRTFTKAKVIVLLCPHVSVESPEQTKEFNNSLDMYNEAIRRICDEHHAVYIDSDGLLVNLDDYHEDDGVHLNQAAYDLIIEGIGRKTQ